MKKLSLFLLCALLFAGCTHRQETPSPSSPSSPSSPTASPVPVGVEAAPTPAPTPSSVPEEAVPAAHLPLNTPAPTPAPPISHGSYRYEDPEGEVWLLNIKANGTFSVIGGERIFNGEGWSDNGDGTVTTGPTDAVGAAPFFDEFGGSRWRIDGECCQPVY